MGIGAGLCMYVVVVQKFTFAISSPDEFLFPIVVHTSVVKIYPDKVVRWSAGNDFCVIFALYFH